MGKNASECRPVAIRMLGYGSVKADDAEITLTLMAQGNDQPKPMELGSFTRALTL